MTEHANGDVGLADAIVAQLEVMRASPLDPALYLIATPIGHLGDISIRALDTLARCDVVYCEDTRHTRKLLQRYALRPRLESYHEHNADRQRAPILTALDGGQRVALVSDAGTPLVSDPGHKLVAAVRQAGHAVFAVPGASAALAAVTASGLAADRFFFEGFLPTKSAARRRRIGMLADVPGLIVIYESPGRLAATLADLAAVLGNRSATVMRELTKRHEAHVPGTLEALAARYDGEDVRGECVILVSPAAVARQVSDGELEADLRKALETQRLGDAAREIAQLHGVARKRVYDLGLALRAARADG